MTIVIIQKNPGNGIYTQLEGLSLNTLIRRRSSYGKVQGGPQRDLIQVCDVENRNSYCKFKRQI